MRPRKPINSVCTEMHGDHGNNSGSILFHYTTQEGLLGILKERHIWASHFRYLNDSMEGQMMSIPLHGFITALKTTTTNETYRSDRQALSEMRSLINDVELMVDSHDAFVSSFSIHGDLLSQWRAYAGTNGGFSIGFDRKWLHGIAADFLVKNRSAFYDDIDPLVRCVYLSKAGYVSATNEERLLSNQPVDKPKESQFPQMMLRMAVAAKHSSFAEEAEWRMAFFLREKAEPSAVEFRAGKSMIVPYLKIPFNGKPNAVGIKKLIVGPCPHQAEAIQAVTLLLKKHSILGVSVEPSNVQYRNW